MNATISAAHRPMEEDRSDGRTMLTLAGIFALITFAVHVASSIYEIGRAHV